MFFLVKKKNGPMSGVWPGPKDGKQRPPYNITRFGRLFTDYGSSIETRTTLT